VSSVEVARHEWEDGTRRLEAARDDVRRYHQLLELLGLIQDELRKRVGQTYTLGELAEAYGVGKCGRASSSTSAARYRAGRAI